MKTYNIEDPHVDEEEQVGMEMPPLVYPPINNEKDASQIAAALRAILQYYDDHGDDASYQEKTKVLKIAARNGLLRDEIGEAVTEDTIDEAKYLHSADKTYMLPVNAEEADGLDKSLTREELVDHIVKADEAKDAPEKPSLGIRFLSGFLRVITLGIFGGLDAVKKYDRYAGIKEALAKPVMDNLGYPARKLDAAQKVIEKTTALEDENILKDYINTGKLPKDDPPQVQPQQKNKNVPLNIEEEYEIQQSLKELSGIDSVLIMKMKGRSTSYSNDPERQKSCENLYKAYENLCRTADDDNKVHPVRKKLFALFGMEKTDDTEKKCAALLDKLKGRSVEEVEGLLRKETDRPQKNLTGSQIDLSKSKNDLNNAQKDLSKSQNVLSKSQNESIFNLV